MTPVNIGYRPGSERNSAILEPYLWIALTILLGVIIGNLFPFIETEFITPVFLILIPVGLMVNQMFSEIKVWLYKHDVDTTRLQGLLDDAIEQLSLRESPKVDLWIGQDLGMTVYCVSTMRHKAIALSESAKSDIVSNPQAGKAILAERAMEIGNPPYLMAFFYSLLFCISTFIGLRRVDLVDWITKSLNLFVLFIILMIVIMIIRYRRGWTQRKEERIENRFGIKLRDALYLVFGGCSNSAQEHLKISRKPQVYAALISYIIIILVYLIVWESFISGQNSGLNPSGLRTGFVMTGIITLPMGILLLIWFLGRRLVNRDTQMKNPDQFCLDVQGLLNDWTQDKAITVSRFSDGDAIIIYDPSGTVFHRGKYLVTDSVAASIQDPNQMVSYLLAQSKLEREYEAYSSLVWAPLLVIALFVPSVLVYGYFRSLLYVLGGDLSVFYIILAFLVLHTFIVILGTIVYRERVKIHDKECFSRYPEHTSVLTKLINDGIISSAGLPSFEERLKSIEKSAEKEVSG